MTRHVDPASTSLPIGRLAVAMAGFDGMQKAAQTAVSFYRERFAYTVTINESDHIYGDVHEWLLELMPTERQRALVVSSRDRSMHGHPEDIADKPEPLRLLFNDKRRRSIQIDGHRVTVEVRSVSEPGGDAKRIPDKAIQFSARTKAGQEAVLGHVRSIHAAKGQRQPVLRIVTAWGSWARRSDLPLRDLESVILPDDQKQSVVGDLRDFLAAEDEYNRLALPWHRGYLLHGPPGTGKTSLVKALAHEFKLDLWYVSLGDLTAESSLINLLAEVSPRSLLLLEDVDTVQLTHERTELVAGTTAKTINLSSLLNALDGVATPHGLITVMTTNHFDRLDPALTRAGRMDRIEELARPTWRDIDAMYRRFYGPDLPPVWPSTGFPSPGDAAPLSQAEVSEIFKRHFGDPAGAARTLGDEVVARS